MSSIIVRQAEPKDYSAIIELQNANTPDQLTEEEKKQGFVVSSMTEETLDDINKNLGVLVAIEDGKLAGFVCLATTNPLPGHPVVKAMYESFPQQIFNDRKLPEYRVFIYGPVLVNSNWRGKGILKKLFSAVKDFTKKNYDLGAAFINDKNPHSLSAHVEGLGMVPLNPFNYKDEAFQLVVFIV
ncbi:GNAT family N-acetyltransferase [Chryseobacterium limigenitum]|uniref:L-amino acid N-acyltransferase YncA n=1 Tax=Chryseobacterium limigenitum TaxID=1612149 RepID=A0A1K2IML9_9FLAO|nr:GNAT family N-acetyltransferase [Chryseobacterium limigenitum]SFZ93498.1 L-amino acid N-acyltransferase YncA [Chryseobacterium limigenitum]